MNYTEDQKSRMMKKLKEMKSGTIFDLNKKDVCPIKVKILKTCSSIHLTAPELDDSVILTVYGSPDSSKTLREVVDTIEDYITNWDLMVKQFFISKARLEGCDP